TVLEEENGPKEEDGQQEVAGHEVRGETDGQRDRPHDDVGDELDRHQQPVPKDERSLGDDARVFEVAEEPMLADADGVVRHPGDQRQGERDRNPAARGEVHEREDLEEVPDEDEEEEREQQGHEAIRRLPQHGDRDVLPDELDAEFHEGLQAPGHDRRFAERQIEQRKEDECRHDDQTEDEVEAEVESGDAHRGSEASIDEILGARRFEGGGEYPDHEGAPSNDQRSACSRPDSNFASETRSAIVAGMRASVNASGENHARVSSPTSTIVKMISRTR